MSKRQLASVSILKRLEQLTLDGLQQNIQKIKTQQNQLMSQWSLLETEKNRELSISLPLAYKINQKDYFERLEADQIHLKNSLEFLDGELKILLSSLSDHFYAKKKIETVESKLKADQKKEIDRKDNIVRDELALMLYNRSNKKPS